MNVCLGNMYLQVPHVNEGSVFWLSFQIRLRRTKTNTGGSGRIWIHANLRPDRFLICNRSCYKRTQINKLDYLFVVILC